MRISRGRRKDAEQESYEKSHADSYPQCRLFLFFFQQCFFIFGLFWRIYPNVFHQCTLVLGLWKQANSLSMVLIIEVSSQTKSWNRHSPIFQTLQMLYVAFPYFYSPSYLWFVLQNKFVSSRNFCSCLLLATCFHLDQIRCFSALFSACCPPSI